MHAANAPAEQSLFTVVNEPDFFDELQTHSVDAVPFLGAGLGGRREPSFPQLNEVMALRAEDGWLEAHPDLDLCGFQVAEALGANFGEQRVRELACEARFAWAYRVVDAPFTGPAAMPPRVVMLTARNLPPK